MLVRYTKELISIWDSAVVLGNNGTFMHQRNFIEYHPEDRFKEHSVIVDNKFIFPANESNDTIYSHQGLSYAGLIGPKQIKLTYYLKVFYELLNYYKEQGFKKIIYKQTPQTYCQEYNGSEDYVLFLVGANCYRRDSNVIVNLNKKPEFSERKRRNIKKGFENKLCVEYLDKDSDYEEYYQKILISCLKNKHNVNPTHSLQEMLKLKNLFPNNIQLQIVKFQDEMIAGVIWFKNRDVNHSQYIASCEKSMKLGGLDFLFSNFMAHTSGSLISFGISNEEQGKILNFGLSDWKNEFGGQVLTHNFYEINLSQNFENLKRNI